MDSCIKVQAMFVPFARTQNTSIPGRITSNDTFVSIILTRTKMTLSFVMCWRSDQKVVLVERGGEFLHVKCSTTMSKPFSGSTGRQVAP
ncbi:hypothetical protein M3J07_005575 [Ascochyta lentis]